MPFDFLKRKRPESEPEPSVVAEPASGIAFDGLTEDWRLVGRMLIEGRLSDALNRRTPIAIADVNWAPIDGSEPMHPAPGLKSIDPYDLILVLTGDDSLPDDPDERDAHRIHKVSYDVGLEVPPYRVVGTVFLYPGSGPDSLLNRAADMFIPIVDATATIEGGPVATSSSAVILVNRQYLRGVEQVDIRTGVRHEKLPGGSLGGVNWTDRAR